MSLSLPTLMSPVLLMSRSPPAGGDMAIQVSPKIDETNMTRVIMFRRSAGMGEQMRWRLRCVWAAGGREGPMQEISVVCRDGTSR